MWASDQPSTLRKEWVEIIDAETAKYRSLHDTGSPGQVAKDVAATESQLSVQALSQAAPAPAPAAASAAPSLLAGPVSAIDRTRRSASASTSAQTRLPAPLSPSPEKEGSGPPPTMRDHSMGTSSRANSHVPRDVHATDKFGQRPRPSHALSDSDSEEEEEVEGRDEDEEKAEDRDEDDPEKLDALGREASSPRRPQDHSEVEVDELDETDEEEINDELLSRRATIDPNLPPSQDNASRSDSAGSAAWSSQARRVPGSYSSEAMDVDGDGGADVGPSAAQLALPVSLSTTDSLDPFVDLGISKPIHRAPRASWGGGRAGQRRTDFHSTSHSPSTMTEAPKILVPSSSSQSRSQSAGSDDMDALADAATSLPSESVGFRPFAMNYDPHAKAAPSSDPITVNDDSADDTQVGPSICPRPSSPSQERPKPKRVRRSREPSQDSPMRPARNPRRSTRRIQGTPNEDDRAPQPCGPGRTRVSKATALPAETVSSSDEGEGDAEDSGSKPGPSHLVAKGKSTPAVKTTNGKGRVKRSEVGLARSSPVVIDDDDDDDAPLSAAPQRQEREESLPPTTTKRRPSQKVYGSAGKNKRRKTEQRTADQPKISQFWSNTSKNDRRGRSCEEPLDVFDDE